jgi:hypothetical protein
MQTVFSQRLLAELRTLHGEEKVRGDDTFQDPDDVIDPDDSGPRLSVTLKEPVAEIYPASAGPATQAEQPAAAAGSPGPPDLLDPAVLRTMPAKVAAFMMHEPRRSPWRYSETAGEQPHREQMEADGSWCG